jgi:hypothetical protein
MPTRSPFEYSLLQPLEEHAEAFKGTTLRPLNVFNFFDSVSWRSFQPKDHPSSAKAAQSL